MTNTDYYLSKEDCDKASREYKNSNSRYRNFCQTYFTAGDEEQFDKARDWSNSRTPKDEVKCQTEFQFDIWNGYVSAEADSITNTFAYIFHKLKKGIYVRIKDNKIASFLPFSKAKFVNEWSEKIRVHPKYKDTIEFLKHINEMEGRHFNEHRVNKFTDEWYANNCLIRYEFPLSEGDTGTSHMKNMLEELCQNRHVPDLEFFVNRRDFPLLKRDGTEPYEHMFDSDNVPLLSHNYEKYAPILSSVSKKNFADLPIPTIDDWARVKLYEGAFFSKTQNRQYSGNFSVPWEDRKPTAIFRGGSTGAGTTIDTNPRLKAAYISSLNERDCLGIPYLDAGITDWNLRPRKLKGEKYLQTIEISNLPFSLVSKLSPEEQCKYRYILHIEGHVCAFRLSLELSMGSTILLVESEYKLWFFHLLKPYEHYVPVKKDLSDLMDKIKWCRENDGKCKDIAYNAKIFFEKYLNKNGILDYLQSLLSQTKKAVGELLYPEKKPVHLLHEQECDWVKKNCIFKHPFEKKRLITTTKNTEIYSCDGYIIKYSKEKKAELLRDVFVFVQGGLKDIPNFVNIHGIDKDGGVIMDKIDGMTLLDWFKKEYNETEFVSILSQIALALHIAQNKSGFVHNDLMPWNVIIQKRKDTFEPEYNIFDKVYRLRPTRLYPVIIDYGKSHIVADNRHHGFINPFKMQSLRDILMLSFSSISSLVCVRKGEKSFLKPKEEQFLINLVNFFCQPTIMPQKFHSFTKMRHFIATHSSFSILTCLNMDDSKNNLNFLQYMQQFHHNAFSIQEPNWNRPVQQKAKKLPTLLFKNKLFVYYFFQQLNDPMLEGDFRNYLLSAKKSENIDIHPVQMDDEIYLSKKRMTKLLHEQEKVDMSLIEEKFLLSSIFSYRGVFEISKNDRKELSDYYEKIDVFKIMHNLANTSTLFDLLF
uniref:Glycosyl transferase CAP10 domain-containing protein n=1 Tax=viral metagenome TaxID=1070528 RepID=A0A6C0KQI6_9ZZZZ